MVGKLLNLSRAKQISLLVLGICLFVIALIIYFPNFARLKKLREENKRIAQENQKLEQEIKDFQEKLQKLGRDPFVYEKIARDDLGVAKENEIVIDIEE